MMRSILAVLCLWISSTLPSRAVPPSKPFLWIDGVVGYTEKPDLTPPWKKFSILYEAELWGPRQAGRDWPPKSLGAAEIERLTLVARRHAKDPGLGICLDVEHLRIKGVEPGLASANIATLLKILAIFRKEAPGRLLGYYALVPIHGKPALLSSPGSAKHEAWVRDNQRVKPLVDAVDFLAPSIYPGTVTQEEWERASGAILAEARKHGKPVYPFVWPGLKDRFGRKTLIEPKRWERMLSWCQDERRADGVIVWQYGAGRAWDGNIWWWQTAERMAKAQKGL